jgi:dihydrofolate synthase/folylpolyglutamate synthase
VRFIAGILERHGIRTGSYTSPHLASFTERVEIGEQPVSDADFAAAVARAAHAAELVNRTQEEGDTVTQFEALTAAAYHELARRGVEVAVIEAGLGGRYDATNVIPSKVQVLTNIGLEHTRWLGPTIKDIAEEKLAVVREHGVLVTGELDPEAEAVAERVATERHARRVHPAAADHYRLVAHGAFQRANFALARAAAEAFLGELDERAVQAAAAEVRVPGRMQVISEDPLTVLDGAHNPAGAEAVAQALPELVGERRLIGVLGVLDDKDAAGMLRALLPRLDCVVFTHSSNPRSLSPATLGSLSEKLGGPASETVADPRRALARARELAGSDGAVVVTGSIYLIADLVRAEGTARASTL